MTKEEFKQLDNFSINEKDIFGREITEDLKNIDKYLMQKIDKCISVAKYEYGNKGAFIVHDINLGKHSVDSFHYKGMAIDGHFQGLNLHQSVMLGIQAGFRGVGFYPDWQHPGVHFDIRGTPHLAMWYKAENEYVYDFSLIIEKLLTQSKRSTNDYSRKNN